MGTGCSKTREGVVIGATKRMCGACVGMRQRRGCSRAHKQTQAWRADSPSLPPSLLSSLSPTHAFIHARARMHARSADTHARPPRVHSISVEDSEPVPHSLEVYRVGSSMQVQGELACPPSLMCWPATTLPEVSGASHSFQSFVRLVQAIGFTSTRWATAHVGPRHTLGNCTRGATAHVRQRQYMVSAKHEGISSTRGQQHRWHQHLQQ